MVSVATAALASAGRSRQRRQTLAIKRERLAALMRRFPGYSREALRHLLGAQYVERYGLVYALAEQRRAARRLSS